MARDPNRRREEIASTVLTRRSHFVVRLSGVFGLFRLSRLAPDRPERRGDNETDQNAASRVSRAPVIYLQLFVMEGGGGGLAWRKDCRALHLFKRGDRLQYVISHA